MIDLMRAGWIAARICPLTMVGKERVSSELEVGIFLL
jgi:hypothetical protein